MPVDRIQRDVAADALASYLRGETDHKALFAVLDRLLYEGSVDDHYLEAFLGSWFSTDMYRPVTEESWMRMCRHLAYLKTDLEERRWDDHDHEDEALANEILLARWHTLGMLLAIGVAYLTVWWLFVVASAISFVLYQMSLRKHESPEDEERKQELKRRQEYDPFTDQADWLAHKHILDEYHLPAYDAAAFEVPPARKWPSILTVPAIWAFSCLLAAFFITIWPVCLLGLSLSRRTIRPSQQTFT